MKIPENLKEKYDEIASMIITFCREKLNDEYKDLCLRLLEKLCRKRSSPLINGHAKTWAAGIVYAIGSNNFIFDKTQKLHLTANEIAAPFGVSSSTAGNKANEIKKIFKIDYFNLEWQLNELIADNPVIWMVQINGFIVDIRDMSPEIQQQAFEMGIIPFIPEKMTENKKQVKDTDVLEENKIIQQNQNKREGESKDQLKLDLF